MEQLGKLAFNYDAVWCVLSGLSALNMLSLQSVGEVSHLPRIVLDFGAFVGLVEVVVCFMVVVGFPELVMDFMTVVFLLGVAVICSNLGSCWSSCGFYRNCVSSWSNCGFYGC